MRKEVWVRHEFIGFHCWPEAPESVKYLSHEHRHLFKVEVHALVSNNERQVEFHLMKNDVVRVCTLLHNQVLKQGESCSMSCESIAEKIYETLSIYNYYPITKISVSEDGECGATLYWE